jgi:hypothetical protein
VARPAHDQAHLLFGKDMRGDALVGGLQKVPVRHLGLWIERGTMLCETTYDFEALGVVKLSRWCLRPGCPAQDEGRGQRFPGIHPVREACETEQHPALATQNETEFSAVDQIPSGQG